MQNITFLKIEDAYAHLETEGYKYNNDIANLFIQFQNVNGLENISCFEIIVFKHLYITDNNKIIENSIYTDTDGNKHPDIDINNFTENFYNHLKKRQEESNHYFLKAYYSHLLWKLPNTIERKDKIKYAQTTVNSYLELIKIYKSDLSIENINEKIYHSTINACMISIEINYEKEVTIKTILESITFFYQQKSIYLNQLISYVVQNFKNFKNKLTNVNLQEICFNSANTFLEINPFTKIFFFRLGEKIDQKFNVSTQNWQLEIAKVYEKMSIERQDLVNSVFCLQALNIYSSLKMEDKIQETAKRYKHLIASRQLIETHQIIDISSQMEIFNTMKEEIFTKDIKEILQLLSSSDNTMVSISEIDSLANSQENNNNTFFNQLPVSVLDNNGHTAQQFEGEELEKYKKLKFYGVLLDIYYNSFVDSLFNELIKKKILTFNILINFLEQNTWFGQEITKMANGFSYEYKWIDFIKPALKNYFEEIDKISEYTGYQPNLILFIDSLTPKIEGVIRDIFELSEEVVFEPKKKDKNLTVQMLLHELFEHKSIRTFISKDNLFFFKFLMVEKVGYNIRNEVSHCLMRYEDYNIKMANLLLIALLKLSHYQPNNLNDNATT